MAAMAPCAASSQGSRSAGGFWTQLGLSLVVQTATGFAHSRLGQPCRCVDSRGLGLGDQGSVWGVPVGSGVTCRGAFATWGCLDVGVTSLGLALGCLWRGAASYPFQTTWSVHGFQSKVHFISAEWA